MAKYFGQFPTIPYNIDRSVDHVNNYDQVTNIMVRVGLIKETLNNVFYYYEYVIKENETPEILAEKYYGDPEAHWLVLLSNNILDPQFDWPLSYDAFNKYIENKYGSLASAQSGIHHYERVIITTDIDTNLQTTVKLPISYEQYVVSVNTELTTYTGTGYSFTIYEYKTSVTNYDYEVAANEGKRNIKLIKKEYYHNVIKPQFESIMLRANGQLFPSGFRTLR